MTKILVLGCGGIGGTVAATLERAGADVTAVTGNVMIAQAIADHGYRVDDFQGPSWAVPARRPARATLDDNRERFDVCVVATQSTTLEKALASALPHLTDDAPVVCCQNGLPEERAAALVGASRVVGCVVGWGASMVEPGRYQRTSKGTLALGRPVAGAPDPTRIANLLEPASPTTVVPDFAAVRWSKLAINCVTTTIGAVGGQRLGSLLAHRFVRRLALEVFAEVADVARASDVKPAPLSGTLDIQKIAITPAERAMRVGSASLAYKHSILLAVGLKYRRMRSSMLYALERGRPPEIDYLNGEVVRRGVTLGVPTPVNQALVATLHRIVNKEARSSLETLRALYDDVMAQQQQSRATVAA